MGDIEYPVKQIKKKKLRELHFIYSFPIFFKISKNKKKCNKIIAWK